VQEREPGAQLARLAIAAEVARLLHEPSRAGRKPLPRVAIQHSPWFTEDREGLARQGP